MFQKKKRVHIYYHNRLVRACAILVAVEELNNNQVFSEDAKHYLEFRKLLVKYMSVYTFKRNLITVNACVAKQQASHTS